MNIRVPIEFKFLLMLIFLKNLCFIDSFFVYWNFWQTLFPGLWLTEVTPDMYKVPEVAP